MGFVGVRLDDDDEARLERLVKTLQARHGPAATVTRSSVVKEALRLLESRTARLERDRERKR